jgi:hypothetical protein
MDGATAVENILTHFGVKGMKWGVRRNRPSAVTVTDKRKKIKTSGGYKRPASSDAVRARSLGQVGKKSGLKSLSDAELSAYTRRLNLEQSVRRLEYNEKNLAGKFVANLLGKNGSQDVETAAKETRRKVGKAIVAAAA